MCGGALTHLSTSPPSYTHHLIRPEPSLSSSTLAEIFNMGQGMCHLHLIIFYLVQNHFGYGGILGGPNAAIGYLFNWLMADCQSPSWFFGYGGILGGHNVAIGYLLNWLMADCQSHSCFFGYGVILGGPNAAIVSV